MEHTFNGDLKKIMALVGSDASQDLLTLEINNLKTEITRYIKESQRISNLLDAIAEQFNIRPPVSPAEKKTPLVSSRTIRNRLKSNDFMIASRFAKDGIIDTKLAVPELRHLGDTRSDRGILIGLGNTMFQHGWKKIGNCKYASPETLKLMEVK
jgi:hypothetical protein